MGQERDQDMPSVEVIAIPIRRCKDGEPAKTVRSWFMEVRVCGRTMWGLGGFATKREAIAYGRSHQPSKWAIETMEGV